MRRRKEAQTTCVVTCVALGGSFIAFSLFSLAILIIEKNSVYNIKNMRQGGILEAATT